MLGTDNITIIKQSNVTDCHISEQLLSTTSERTKHIYKFNITLLPQAKVLFLSQAV